MRRSLCAVPTILWPSKRWRPPPSKPPTSTCKWPAYDVDAPDRPVCKWPPLPDTLEEDVHMAADVEPLGDDELAQQPDCVDQRGWLDSDDAPVSENGMSVTLVGLTGSRQSVVSRDWVHEDHKPPARTWSVRADKATHDFGDIYFGLTEAQCFANPGDTAVFDVRGNARYGPHPLDLTMHVARRTVELGPDVTFIGAFEGGKDDALDITIDLHAQTLTIFNTVSGDTLRAKLPGHWRCARLCATLRTPGDTLTIR